MTNKQITVVIAEVVSGQRLHLLPGAVKLLVVCSPSVRVLCMRCPLVMALRYFNITVSLVRVLTLRFVE